MITQTFRPQSFDEMVGNELNIKVLKAIIRHPETAPRCIIMSGPPGCGKTTSSRILARALNCESPRTRPCGQCDNCKRSQGDGINTVEFYTEYDSSVIGNVDRIRELRDTFSYHQATGYKIILLDEANNCSSQAQAALLKVIEEVPERVFFIFCTNFPDKILPMIRSRSIELEFTVAKEEEVIVSLKSIAEKLGMTIPEDIFHIIARKSGGLMRSAHMLLDQYRLIGEHDFRTLVRTSRSAFLDYFRAFSTKQKTECFSALNELMTFPIADLKADFQSVLLEIVEIFCGARQPADTKVSEVVRLLGPDTIRLYRNAISEWVMGSFTSDETIKASLLSLWRLLAPQINGGAG